MTGEEATHRFIRELNAIGAKYMVVGSFSSNYYGVPRSTKDADIVVSVEAEEIADLQRNLKGEFQLNPQMGFETIGATTKYEFTASETLFKIEVFELSDDAFDQERFRRRVQGNIGGVPTFIPTAEDVVIQKLRWARERDKSDVREVLSVQGVGIDWPYVLKWCDEHGSRDVLDAICGELGIDPAT